MATFARKPYKSQSLGLTYNAGTIRRQFINVEQGIPPQTVRTILASDDATVDDQTILVDCTASDVTVMLPPADKAQNFVLTVKRIDNSVHSVTVEASDGSLIDGISSLSLATQWKTRTVQSDGAAYYVTGGFG